VIDKKADQQRVIPILKALLVTFLWSSSYVLIKMGLIEILPLTFAALRYTTAFLILVLVMILKGRARPLHRPSSIEWLTLICVGAFGYAGAQGLQFVGLHYIPVILASFLLNFSPVFVVLLGAGFLHEIPTIAQTIGIVVALAGAYVFFGNPLQSFEAFGVFITLLSGLCWAVYMIIARSLQKTGRIPTLEMTTVTMGAGAVILLVSGFALEGPPSVPSSGWVIIGWLSIVNTVAAFYLWNQVLESVKAYELSMLQNTMLVQTSLMALIFLGEQVTVDMILGMILVLSGVTLVQARR